MSVSTASLVAWTRWSERAINRVLLPMVVSFMAIAATAAAPVDDAQALALKLEALELGDASKGGVRSPASALADAEKALDRHLRQHADDVPALIVAARLARLRAVVQPLTLRFGPGAASREQMEAQFAPLTEAIAHAHARIDRALALQEQNASAHFWKARLHATALPVWRDGRPVMGGDDAGAERELRRALELAPAEDSYREHLALNLSSGQRFAEAADVAAPLGGGRHPLVELLREIRSLPLPDAAIPWPPESRTLAQSGLAPQPFAAARVLAALVPGLAKDVETYCARVRPGFRLLRDESLRDPNINLQWLHLGDGAVRFASAAGELPPRPRDGIMLSVIETDKPALIDDPARFPLAAGSRHCRLWFINLRPVEGPR